MNRNPYFNTETVSVTPVQKFEQFEPVEHDVEIQPAETIPGLTSIIMPVYLNSYPVFHYTGNAIGSIREHTDKIKTPYEIIMVLQASPIKFGKLEETKADKVIELEENVGFAKAVNKGIRAASGEYIAILNNDIMVFNHWLEDMQRCLTQLDLIMATPMYGQPFARAVEAQELRNKTIKEGDLVATDGIIEEDYVKKTFSDFTDFSCVLTRKELFDKIGLFNEEFEMYCEDLDFLRRMKKEGLKYASTKRVNIFHIISGTASGEPNTAEIMNKSKEKLKEIWGY